MKQPRPHLVFPEVGSKVLCGVIKSTFSQAILKIMEIEDVSTEIEYKVILKGNSVGEEVFVCDTIKEFDKIRCIITSISDTGIFVSKYE